MAQNAQALSISCYDAFFSMGNDELQEIWDLYDLEGEFEDIAEMSSVLNGIKSRFIFGKAFYNHSAVQEDVWYVDPSNPAPFDDQEMWLFYGALDTGIMSCDIESEYAVLMESDEVAIIN